MKYSMSRFLFLLFVCGFACSLSNVVVIAMMNDGSGYGEEDSNSYGNDSYNNGGGYAGNNNNYAQYGNDNSYQQNGNGFYQSQQSQQWNNGQYNNENQHSNGNRGGYNANNGNSNGNYQNNNAQNRSNEAIALADNREVNQRIEKAINELNTLKKNVNQRFSQIQQQRNERNGGKNNTDANKDKKTGKDLNKRFLTRLGW